MNNTARNIKFYRLRTLSLASRFYRNETVVEQQFTYVHRLHGSCLVIVYYLSIIRAPWSSRWYRHSNFFGYIFFSLAFIELNLAGLALDLVD